MDFISEGSKEFLTNFLAQAMVVGHTMCYINSAINPFIYYFMSAAFRKQVSWHCGVDIYFENNFTIVILL